MARTVSPTAPLPYAGSSTGVYDLARFDADLVRALTMYLRDLAERANGSLPKDGSEAMTGPLNLGNFSLMTTGLVSTGDLTVNGTLGVTGLTTTNGQIAFPAAQNPSTDVNVLDDYEEGTWTLGVEFGGASVGVTYDVNSGSYVKIGKMVYIRGQFNLTSQGSSVGSASITGLPFVAGGNAAAAVGLYINFQTNVLGITLNVVIGTSMINIYNTVAGSQTQLTQANFTNTAIIIFSGTYEVA